MSTLSQIVNADRRQPRCGRGHPPPASHSRGERRGAGQRKGQIAGRAQARNGMFEKGLEPVYPMFDHCVAVRTVRRSLPALRKNGFRRSDQTSY
jgi:hypothetical protein